ncbi:hypothetical protein ACFLTP_06245 [Chloroflexota bacterium]
MKKLTKLHYILIGILILVLVGSVYMSFQYRKAEGKLPEIQKEIELATMQLKVAQENNDLDTLKKQLGDLEIKISRINTSPFPEKAPSVEIGDLIVDSIDKFNLELLKLLSNEKAGTETIKSNEEDSNSSISKYNKAEYDVSVRGYLGRINSLLAEIEGSTFVTLTIDDLDITLDDEDEDTVVDIWTADFTIVTLYLYEEDE